MNRKIATLFLLIMAMCSRHIQAADIKNPYEGIDWDAVEFVHSFSHQHASTSKFSDLWEMGYRHFPISNYYPSKPVYPMPDNFLKKYPEAISSPNAEQHSTTDAMLHFNVLGSHYSTGYGRYPSVDIGVSPIENEFTNLVVFDPAKEPWRGVYRLDLVISAAAGAKEEEAKAYLTVEGARQCSIDFMQLENDKDVKEEELTPESQSSRRLRTLENSIKVKIVFDPTTTTIKRLRLMQGTNRPWREAFRAGLDGNLKDADGKPLEGLLFDDGGGITLNHPRDPLETTFDMLDFDDRVLGVEAWNYRRVFGDGKEMSFYKCWEAALNSGRRCYGFFVKDHYLYGRGRNVLLMPKGVTGTQERERAALRAYCEGQFFGLLGSMNVGDAGEAVMPFDYSEFRFTRIQLHRKDGNPASLEVAVSGADDKRPNTQIRFITESGVSKIIDASSGTYTFPLDQNGAVSHRYVRVEAYAYPNTQQGKPLTAADISSMNPFEIARLHDVRGTKFLPDMDKSAKSTPLGIVDMIFSQAIMF